MQEVTSSKLELQSGETWLVQSLSRAGGAFGSKETLYRAWAGSVGYRSQSVGLGEGAALAPIDEVEHCRMASRVLRGFRGVGRCCTTANGQGAPSGG